MDVVKRVIQGFERAGISYGDHISHNDIDGWADIAYPDFDRIPKNEQREAVNKFSLERLLAVEGLKQYLLHDRMMYLKSVYGSGYRIVRPEEQTEVAVRDGMKKITKGLKQAQVGTEQVNKALLTAEQREFNVSVKARLSGLARMVGKKRDYLELK